MASDTKDCDTHFCTSLEIIDPNQRDNQHMNSSQSTCDGCGLPPRLQPDGLSEVPLKRCARCRQAAYHDAECQRQHYKIHKSSCRQSLSTATTARTRYPFVIQQRDKEKCLVTDRELRPGEAVLTAEGNASFRPLVPPVLFRSCRTTHCAVCFGKLSIQKTVLLSDARYPVSVCSEPCMFNSRNWLPQEVDAVKGSLVGMDASNMRDAQIFPTAILVYRLLLQSVESWKEIMAMHIPERKPQQDDDAERAHQLAVFAVLMQLTFQTDGLDRKIMMETDMFRNKVVAPLPYVTRMFLLRINCNAFTVTNGDACALGIALYESPSYRINHSCDCNTVQSFLFAPGTSPCLRLEVVRPVAKGDEVCISYIDTLDSSVTARQEVLERDYYFHCRCTRCKAEE
jgi:SET domain/MYND finger